MVAQCQSRHIAVVIPASRAGGVRQSAETIVEALDVEGVRISAIALDPQDSTVKARRILPFDVPGTRMQRVRQYLALYLGRPTVDTMRLEALLSEANVDLVIFPTPLGCPPPRNCPFVVVVPDLMHRYYPAFPEYRWPKTLARDIVYGRYARNAASVVVDAEVGARDVERFLSVPLTKCRVVPFRPSPSIYGAATMTAVDARTITKRFNLPSRFLFFPAQLWRHKNHRRLILALGKLKREHGISVSLVCAGWIDGKFAREASAVQKLAVEQGVSEQLKFTGYVSPDEIAALYRLARALVFPSLLGPTNIPPLEAMVMGAPVLCSNLFGMPEQVRDAGLLFNPFSIDEMANAIFRVWTDDTLCIELAHRGAARIAELDAVPTTALWLSIISEALTSRVA